MFRQLLRLHVSREVTNTSHGSGVHDSFPGGEDIFNAYSGKLNLRQIHFGEDMKSSENHEYLSQAQNAKPRLVLLRLHTHDISAALAGEHEQCPVLQGSSSYV